MNKQNNVTPIYLNDIDGTVEEKVPSVSHDVDMHHMDEQVEHSLVSFHDVNYTVKIKKSLFGSCRAKEPKKILTNVRFVIVEFFSGLCLLTFKFAIFF